MKASSSASGALRSFVKHHKDALIRFDSGTAVTEVEASPGFKGVWQLTRRTVSGPWVWVPALAVQVVMVVSQLPPDIVPRVIGLAKDRCLDIRPATLREE